MSVSFVSPRNFAAVIAMTLAARAWSIDYIQVVPSGPPPAPDIAKDFGGVARGKALKSLVEYLGSEFNQSQVRANMQSRFNAALDTGWKEAERLGQVGMVIRVRYRIMQGEQPVYGLRDEDVVYIGVGPSVLDVCISARCDLEMQPGPPPGTTFGKDSGYVWITPKAPNGSPAMRLYRNASVIDPVRLTVFSDQLVKQRQQEIRGAALDGYTKRLTEKVAASKDQEPVKALIADRDEARQKLADVEKRLAEERERARKAADAAKMLNAFASAFSLASSIAVANASTGLDLEQIAGGKIPSKEDLQALVGKLAKEAGGKVKELEILQTTQRDSTTGAETKLIGIGVRYGMDPKDNNVFNPPKLP